VSVWCSESKKKKECSEFAMCVNKEKCGAVREFT